MKNVKRRFITSYLYRAFSVFIRPVQCLSILALFCLLTGYHAQAQTLTLNEGFDDVNNLAAADWVQKNNSVPLGIRAWFQGDTPFESFDGGDTAYIAVNFKSISGMGVISN